MSQSNQRRSWNMFFSFSPWQQTSAGQCFPAAVILRSHPSEWVWAGHCGLSTEALLEKTWGEIVWGTWTQRQQHWAQLKGDWANFQGATTMPLVVSTNIENSTGPERVPVQMAIVFKVLCPMASFDVFNDMGLEELFEQLQSLIASHLRPKVVVAPQQLMQIIHSLRSCETPVIVAEVCPVPSQRHASTEQFNGFIPLHNMKTLLDNVVWLMMKNVKRQKISTDSK